MISFFTIFILLFTVAICDIVDINYCDWKSIADDFNTLANAAPDGLVMTKILKNSAGGFLKMGMPLGGLFATALKLGSDSAEYKAITALDLRMQKGFNQTRHNINNAKAEILFDHKLGSFNRDIIHNMYLFEDELNVMKEPTRKTQTQIKKFVRNWCKSKITGPLNLLRKTDIYLRRFYTNEKYIKMIDEKMLKWKVTLRQTLLGNNVVLKDDFHEYEICSNDVFEQVSMMNFENSEIALRWIEKEVQRSSKLFAKTKNACDAVMFIIDDYPKGSAPDCLMERLLQARQYKHEPLHHFSALISSVSLNLLNFGIFCNNISNGHNPVEYNSYNKSLLTEFESITDTLLQWIPVNLNRSWPHFEKEVVNDIISNSPHPVITPKHYIKINRAVSHNLSQYGNKDYHKQYMISRNYFSFNYYVNCAHGSCFETTNHPKEVHIQVSRYIYSDYRRSLTAGQWAIENTNAINATFRAHRHTPYLKDLDAFFFDENNQHLLQHDRYNSMVIIRDSGIQFCSIEDYAIRFFRGGAKINGAHVINLSYKEFEGCVKFKLIFFI
uniref:Uncharacterized protein n=1 Tax=Panagrolaimus davidi TaxID=227884 RepID=A0A914PH28_9BILA